LQRQALSVRVLDYETLGEESGACGHEERRQRRLFDTPDPHRGRPQPGPLQR
jgi:hypothetical protein